MPRRKKSSHENQSRSSLSINKDKPQQRYAANARERARMRVLSRAFCKLKTTLPWVPADTKLSKLDTLRLAASYIAHLKGILKDETLGSSESSLHPAMSMTWPFGFNRPLGGSPGGGSQEGGSILGSEDDDDDIDDDDGGSISSCTWEEVCPPSAKDCIHLDSGKGRARGSSKPSNNSSTRQQVHTKREDSLVSPSNNLHKQNRMSTPNPNIKSEDFPLDNNGNSTIMRPLSQTQHHHHHHHQQDHLNESEMFHHHFETEINKPNNLAAMMAVTNLENAPPPPHLHSTPNQQNEILVGVGNTGMDSFLGDINGGNGFAQIGHHHINHGDNEIHHHHPSASVAFGFGSNDLISIG